MSMTNESPAGMQDDRRAVSTRWRMFSKGRTFQCRVVVMEEEDGFSVFAADLPGTVSQGNTIEEALSNINEALVGSLSEYLRDGKIPWQHVEVDGKVVSEKRILVHV